MATPEATTEQAEGREGYEVPAVSVLGLLADITQGTFLSGVADSSGFGCAQS